MTNELDATLTAAENPIRRRIIRRLSQEPSYPFELAKEIGAGQQAVTSHLNVLEHDGIVGSTMEASPFGPKRRQYYLKKSVYLTVSFGPHLYNEQFFSFETLPTKMTNDARSFLGRIDEIRQSKQGGKIESLADLIGEIDTELARIEEEKLVLLYLRNFAMQQATEEFDAQEKSHDEKRVLHFLLDEGSEDVEIISNILNLRESVIREILTKLKKDSSFS